MDKKALFWVLVMLNLLDVWLTSQILNLGGRELNPIMIFFIDQFGHIGLIIGKFPIVILGVVIYFYWDKVRKHIQEGTMTFLRTVNYLFVAVNSWSLFVLFKLASL